MAHLEGMATAPTPSPSWFIAGARERPLGKCQSLVIRGSLKACWEARSVLMLC